MPFDPQASSQPYEQQGAVNEILALHCEASGAKINVMQPSTKSSVTPIIAFHSTIMMNWVSYDGITCCYPLLTFQLQGLSNVLPMFKTAKKALALEKYKDRGYQLYESCTQLSYHTIRACEEEQPRNIRTPNGMYLGTNACNPYCKCRVRKVNDGKEMSMSFYPGTVVEDHKYCVAWRLARVLEGTEADCLKCQYPRSPRVLKRKGWISVDRLMIYQESPKNIAMASGTQAV
ncbi:hypothetical protein BKA70DRAFT_1226608 [Coprinopsis sp. MPI-PUGE-AT-0042]|nr:hypothetical protein BKA70DRAFT_1226608 [Coprinopsis sp. MPI-PUGE-AT-0042]